MNVDPKGAIGNGGAKISHSGSSALSVTITNESGDSVTIEVPAGVEVTWIPPAGWTSATFNASGHDEEFRLIEREAGA